MIYIFENYIFGQHFVGHSVAVRQCYWRCDSCGFDSHSGIYSYSVEFWGWVKHEAEKKIFYKISLYKIWNRYQITKCFYRIKYVFNVYVN